MFRPNAQAKRILRKAQCAYVLPDGIAVWEERTAKAGKYSTRIDVWHVWRGETPISQHRYKRGASYSCEYVKESVGVGFHHPKLLLDGLATIRIAYNNSSQASQQLNIYADSVTCVLPSGAEWSIDLFSFFAGDLFIMNDGHSTSVEQIVDREQHIEEHEGCFK